MKIILSRKGFDTSSGGVPSPIFPDGTMLSLPIPDKQSTIQYKTLNWEEFNVGDIVSSLTKKKIKPQHNAHVDPDLNSHTLPRRKEWKPLFGQVAAAQGHLRLQHVAPGDVFIFFGLFRKVHLTDVGPRYNNGALPRHVIWGWLQIEKIVEVDRADKNIRKWATYHPHFHRRPDVTNTIYAGKDQLEIPGHGDLSISGAGVFRHFSKSLQLTQQISEKVSVWELPGWFYPSDGKPALTYHSDPKRWKKNKSTVILQTVSRGQEFILDCAHYPESVNWLICLLRNEK